MPLNSGNEVSHALDDEAITICLALFGGAAREGGARGGGSRAVTGGGGEAGQRGVEEVVQRGVPGCGVRGRGLHSFTCQLNLSRF